VSSVSKNGLAGVESYFLFGPEDAVAEAIGNVNLASGREANKGSGLHAKIGIMMRGDGISGQCGLQFAPVACATRNN
jgi:hypothetical protein